MPKNLNGLNLFAYCLNNPIIYIDKVGNEPSFNLSIEVFALIDYENYLWISNRYIPIRKYEYGFSLSNLWNNFLCSGEEFLSGFEIRLGREELEFIKFSSSGFTVLSAGYDWTQIRYYVDKDYLGLIIGSISAELGFDIEEGIGFDLEATICTIGVYSEFVDAEFLLGSYSASLKYENGSIKIGISVGWGFQLTIRKWW